MKKIYQIQLLLFIALFIGCDGETLEVVINTPSIQCGMCERNIEMGLSNVKGISASKVDLATKVTKVKYFKDRIDISKIEKEISNLGYQANDILADNIKYESLPACCKIGGMDKI